LQATQLMREHRQVVFFSSMGAALRTNPLAVGSAEFWEVQGDPLARMLRKRFKSMREYPAHKFLCVYSTELPRENRGEPVAPESVGGPAAKARINGTMAPVTMAFGVSLAGLVVNDVEKKMSF
jgi:tRNA A37 threonylcarbamoyladenosine dehydratase